VLAQMAALAAAQVEKALDHHCKLLELETLHLQVRHKDQVAARQRQV
jgi:hypothetical protein